MEEKEREGGKRETERESERETQRGMTERKSTTGERERGSRPTTLLLSIYYYCLVLVLVPFSFYFKVPRLSL